MEVRYKPFSFLDAMLGLTGGLLLIAGGAFLVFAGISFAQQAVNGDPGGLRYVFGGGAVLMGVFLVLFSLFGLYATVTLPFDRHVKLSFTEEALTDYRFRPPLVIRWDAVRSVSVRVVTMNLVRQSALATLEMGPEHDPLKVELHGLDRDAEELSRLIADRIAGASRRESLPCPACGGRGFTVRTLPDFPGTLQSNCGECEGSGLTPGIAREEWGRRRPAELESLLTDLFGGAVRGAVPDSPATKTPGEKRPCQACNGHSPGTAKACYHCGKTFS